MLSSTSALAAETYRATAETTLSVEDGEFVQRYSVSCVAEDPAEDARLTTVGRDLRFFLAPELPVATGVDGTIHSPDDVVAGEWRAALIPGARVFARLVARCGSANVFHQVTVDSSPVVVPPELTAPSTLQRTDDLRVVGLETIPVGAEVEVVGLSVHASPRGTEAVTIHIEGAGIDESFDIRAADIGTGTTAISPTFTPTTTGSVVISATFLDSSSLPVELAVIEADTISVVDGGEDIVVSSCNAGVEPASASLFVLVAGMLRRRRQRR